jgi:hypothetical protein
MLDQSSAPVDPFNFWKMLQYFWSDGHIQEWRDAIFRAQNNPHKGVETCCNLICLSRDAHAYWTKAYFALKPIQLSEDKKSLDVEFHWLPKYNNSPTPVLDILTPPKSLSGRDDMQLFDFRTGQRICSGQRISLTTDDPDNQPLPHLALLEMQWVLHRLTAMSGAAEIYDDFDNDDDDAMVLWNEGNWYEEDVGVSSIEDDWNFCKEESLPMMDAQSSPPMMDHQPSPPSSPLRQSSLPRQPFLSHPPKSNIRSDYIPLQPEENLGIKIISSSQGQ